MKLSETNYDVLLPYRSGARPVGEDGLSAREQWLADNKLIEVNELHCRQMQGITIIGEADSYRITPAGEDALLEFERERNKEAKAERQQRFENKVSVANVLVPTITFFLGMIVEHFSGLVAAVAALVS